MSKIYSLVELQSILNPIFSEHGVRKAVLFGSYTKGTATEHSDVDLLVDSGLRGLKFFGLLESVTCALKFPVDLLDVTQIEHGSMVEREIQNSGVAIYGHSKKYQFDSEFILLRLDKTTKICVPMGNSPMKGDAENSAGFL